MSQMLERFQTARSFVSIGQASHCSQLTTVVVLSHRHGHMLTHEEDKPHKCRIPNCKRTYCDARSLKRHIENAHQNILAAIHEGGNENYRDFLPETAFVKPKDATMNNDFSIDSVESHSSHSFNDADASTRPSNGNRLLPTYTYVLHSTSGIVNQPRRSRLDSTRRNPSSVTSASEASRTVLH